MKKAGSYLIPILFILIFAFVTPKVFSGTMSKSSLLTLVAVLFAVMFLFRPKKAATKTSEEVAAEVLDDFSSDAFADDEALKAKFYAALNDIGANCPKAAVSKLEKLAPQCSGSKETYAVALAAALAWRKQQDYKNAIREYNKAVVLHPSGKLAYTIGDAHQRLGNLDKAKDSYEFASELEPGNPQYFSSLATVHVAEGSYNDAIDTAMEALDLDENHASALATLAICYGIQDNSLMHKHYTDLAVENGYSADKIKETIKALKKR